MAPQIKTYYVYRLGAATLYHAEAIHSLREGVSAGLHPGGSYICVMEAQFEGFEVSNWLTWFQTMYPDVRVTLPSSCLPGEYIPVQREAYRFVKDHTINDFDFLPRFFEVPGYRDSEDEGTKCAALGLSMFDSGNAALKRYQSLGRYKTFEWLKEHLGTHLAFLTLMESDGLSQPEVEKSGHYTHFPFVGRDYAQRFQTIDAL